MEDRRRENSTRQLQKEAEDGESHVCVCVCVCHLRIADAMEYPEVESEIAEWHTRSRAESSRARGHLRPGPDLTRTGPIVRQRQLVDRRVCRSMFVMGPQVSTEDHWQLACANTQLLYKSREQKGTGRKRTIQYNINGCA